LRPKIAFLTVLTINVVCFGGYWLIRFLGWQANLVLHAFPGGHKCPADDVPLGIIIVMLEATGTMFLIGGGFLVTWALRYVYQEIDKLFPERGIK